MSEEFLTTRDFEIAHLPIPDDDVLNSINQPKIEDDDSRSDLDNLLDGENPIGLTINGDPLYMPDDPGDMYKVPERESLKGVVLGKGIYVKSNAPNQYKAGFTVSESTVARKKNDEGKWPTKQGLKLYEAISTVLFSFFSERSGKNIEMQFDPGDLFWAQKNGEKKQPQKKKL